MSLIRRHHVMATLAFLTLLELLTFGDIARKVGFYLDDWNMLRQLHFGPQNFFEMLPSYFLQDPRLLPRPVEALHFALMYTAFGLKPLGYHVFNGVMEVLTALLAYVVVQRAFGNRVLALSSAAIFLLYPIHDSTHYWVVASSATLSLLCYMASLWCHVEANARSNRWLFAGAYSLFAVSIFNYECYLPLFPLTVAAALYVTPRASMAKRAVVQSIPYVLSIGALLAYDKFIVPLLGQAWLHPAQINPTAIVNTTIEGLQVSISPTPFTFLWSLLVRDDAITQPLGWIAVIAATAAGGFLIRVFASEKMDRSRLAHAACFGVALVAFSYTIFGLNPEYEPTLLTMVNRINYAAAFGGALFFAAAICWLATLPPRMNSAITTAGLAFFLGFCMFSNWALARPWMLSWMMQRHVQSVLTAHKGDFKSGDSIMLVNSPRYVRWAPLFDGPWDFQNLLQITLADDTISGGVVSERLRVSPNEVTDVSADFLCGRYNFGRLHALVATESAVIPMRSAHEFIDLVSTRGMGFDLDKNLPAVWRDQCKLATKPVLTQ